MSHRVSVIWFVIALVVPGMVNGQQSACYLQKTKPQPAVNKYVYEDCIVAQFAGYFIHRTYKTYMPIENGTVNSVQSSCNFGNDHTQLLAIKFSCGHIDLYFKQNALNQTYLYYTTGILNYANSSLVFTNNTPLFNTAPCHYYKCEAEQNLTFDSVSLSLKNVALEAYRSASGTDFSKIPDECYMDSKPVSKLVGIWVLVLLVVLVAICVVIAYKRGWLKCKY